MDRSAGPVDQPEPGPARHSPAAAYRWRLRWQRSTDADPRIPAPGLPARLGWCLPATAERPAPGFPARMSAPPVLRVQERAARGPPGSRADKREGRREFVSAQSVRPSDVLSVILATPRIARRYPAKFALSSRVAPPATQRTHVVVEYQEFLEQNDALPLSPELPKKVA